MKRLFQTLIGITAFGPLITLLAGCGKPTTNKAKTSIMVSVPPLAYFTKAIGGDSVTVTTLINSASDPETFEPGMKDMRALANANAFFTTGVLPFEQAITAKLSSNFPDLELTSISDSIDLIYGTHVHHHEGKAHHHDDAEPDPHIWSSTVNAKIIALNVFKALSSIKPDAHGYFQKRYNSLIAHIDSLDCAYRQSLAESDAKAFAIWHPSLSYFARDYDLEQIAFNIENKENSTLQFHNNIKNAKEAAPKTFFIPQGTNPNSVSTISKQLNVKPFEINLMSEDWDSEMTKVVEALTANQPS